MASVYSMVSGSGAARFIANAEMMGSVQINSGTSGAANGGFQSLPVSGSDMFKTLASRHTTKLSGTNGLALDGSALSKSFKEYTSLDKSVPATILTGSASKSFLSSSFLNVSGSVIQALNYLEARVSTATGINGSGGASQVAYFTDSDTIASDQDLTFDGQAFSFGGNNGTTFNVDATALTLDGTSASNLTATGANLTVSTATSGELIINSAGVLDIDSAAGMEIDAETSLSLDAKDDSNLTVTGSGKNLSLIVAGGSTQVLGLDSAGTGANAIDLNATGGGITVDAETTLSLDAKDDSNLTVTGAAKDLTVAVAGGGAQILTLSSAGTGNDALAVTASGGGMDITSAKVMDITTSANNANITIDPHGSGTLTLGSDDNTKADVNALTVELDAGTGGLVLDSAKTGTDSITLDSLGGISIDAVDTSNITLTAAANGDDLTIAVEGDKDASLVLSSDGTGSDAVQVTASAGGMDITSAAAMDITTSAGNTNITIDPHGSGTLQLGSSDNTGVNIDAQAFSLDANAGASNISIATAGDAQDLSIGITGGTNSSLLLSSTGTGADAIGLSTSTGGIAVDAAGALDLDAAGAVTLDSTAAGVTIGSAIADGQTIVVGRSAAANIEIAHTTNAATETIGITNTDGTAVGTSGGAINVGAQAGGINLTAGGDDAAAVALLASAGGVTVGVNPEGLYGEDKYQGFAVKNVGSTAHYAFINDKGATFPVAKSAGYAVNASGTMAVAVGASAKSISMSALPVIGMLGIDSAGVLQQYYLQVSGGIMQVQQA